MVDDLVYEVRSNQKVTRISASTENLNKTKKAATRNSKNKKSVVGKTCPKCKNGQLVKGKTAFGCNQYKKGCHFTIPFVFLDKKFSENQLIRLLDKGCTTNLKGFKTTAGKVEGLVRFDENFQLKLEPKQTVIKDKMKPSNNSVEKISCPKCKKGTILKGKTAYGCSNYNKGCDFVFSFEKIKKIANGKPLTKELVLKILDSK